MSKKNEKKVKSVIQEDTEEKLIDDGTVVNEETQQVDLEDVENKVEYTVIEQFRDGTDGTVYKVGNMYTGSTSEERLAILLGENVYKKAFIKNNE